jgi:hypothetical protein
VKNASTDDRLDTIIELLKLSVALQLAQSGVKQTVIAKHIHVATAKVGTMLQGVRRPGGLSATNARSEYEETE